MSTTDLREDGSNDYHMPHKTGVFCSNCGHEVQLVLPVSPVYDLDFVASILPCSKRRLYEYIQKLHIPPLYRRPRKGARYVRVLMADHVRQIQEHLISIKVANGTYYTLAHYRRLKEQQGEEEGAKAVPVVIDRNEG